MPNRINEIVIGPLEPLQDDCLLEVKDNFVKKPYRIVDKYVYPNFLTHMITLTVITPRLYIIKPGYLLASLCVITTKKIFEESDGKNIQIF